VLFALELPPETTSPPERAGGYRIRWTRVSGFTGMVIKKDPGQPLVLVAFGALLVGLVAAFYFPRRRVWSFLADGRLRLAVRGDRYVNEERELGEILDALRLRIRTPAESHSVNAPPLPAEPC
jgi:cytochrome c biogenesis protein ResB